jgi:hypothetical protein
MKIRTYQDRIYALIEEKEYDRALDAVNRAFKKYRATLDDSPGEIEDYARLLSLKACIYAEMPFKGESCQEFIDCVTASAGASLFAYRKEEELQEKEESSSGYQLKLF